MGDAASSVRAFKVTGYMPGTIRDTRWPNSMVVIADTPSRAALFAREQFADFDVHTVEALLPAFPVYRADLPMFSRLTERAQRVLDRSVREALQLGHPHVETEHILLALIRDEEGVAGRVLRDDLSVDVRRAIINRLQAEMDQ